MVIKNLLDILVYKNRKNVKMTWQGGPLKLQPSFYLYDSKLGNLKIDINSEKIDYSGGTLVSIYLKKLFANDFLSREKLTINPNNSINGHIIETNKEYRKNNYRFGELIRLLTIAQMNENKSPVFNLVSMNDSIYFHAKYKFLPFIQESDKLYNVLFSISKDKDRKLENFSNAAKKMLQEYRTLPVTKLNWYNNGNRLVGDYLNKVLELKLPHEEHKLNTNISMRLTRKHLLDNKDWFNALFAKHGIEYQL